MSLTARAPEPSDRDRMLEWRNHERVRAVSVNDRRIPPDEHAAWFERAVADRSDQLLVVGWDGQPVAVVQLESIDLAQMTSSWGVHLGVFDVPPGVGAALPLIGLGLGFGRWQLRRMTAQVLATNRNMVSMHRRFGVPIEGLRRQHVRRSTGECVDVHEYGVLAPEWPDIRSAGLRLLPSQVRIAVDEVLTSLVPRGDQ